MARNNKITTHLRNTTRGASIIEYSVLMGLLGAVALGAVLAFGINVQDNTEEIQTRVDSVVALANSGAPSGGGSGGTGTGGTGAQTPPVDVFASCETGFGPNPAAIRGNGDGSLLSGGNDSQIIYALANALVDGGEGGTDLDVLMVPGAGAVATFNGTNPESGRVDVGTGSVVFSNIEMVVLCDAGGEVSSPWIQVGRGIAAEDYYNAIHLGPIQDFDPVEGNTAAENAVAVLNAQTFGSVAAPLHERIVRAFPQQDLSNTDLLIWADNGGYPGEGYLIENGVLDGKTVMLDSGVSVSATVSYVDGTTGSGTYTAVLVKDGPARELLLFAPMPVLVGLGPINALQAAPIESITITAVGGAASGGLHNRQWDVIFWVAEP